MSFAKIYSGQSDIIGANIIHIESDISRGLYSFNLVGLPDKAVEESRDRVSSAIKNTGFESPKSKNHKVVISLAPADIKKEGPAFDLPIALSYLLSSGEIIFDPEKKLFLGELALSGEVRPVNGVLAIIREAKKRGFEEVFVPNDNSKEAGLIRGIKVFAVKDLAEVINHLDRKEHDRPHTHLTEIGETDISDFDAHEEEVDFAHIKGHASAKRALEIAASGGHNILMWGSPGTGKTMLAKAFKGILPPLSYEDTLEATSIHGSVGALKNTIITTPPFRSPHHTSSHVAIVGGGAHLRPGEITLAHKGVLFLDEFPEFDRRVIESLREPLEERIIKVSRAKGTATFPADFILVAAMNPCPCGNFGSTKRCVCNPLAVQRYQRKISGPILDRIDMWIEVAEVNHETLNTKKESESSKAIQQRVKEARQRQRERAIKYKMKTARNSDIKAKHINNVVELEKDAEKILTDSGTKLGLSPRAYHRTLRLARTIADIESSETIKVPHVLEALQYRQKREIV